MPGMIPRDFIDDLLTRADIVSVVDEFVPLKKAGKNFQACCPFHNENSPSFTVSPEKQFYHCFGCGAHGNAITFLMEHERMEFVQAVESLAKMQGLTVPTTEAAGYKSPQNAEAYELHQQALQFFHNALFNHPEHETVVRYLKRRGVTKDSVEGFKIGFAPPGWDNLLQQVDSAKQKALVSSGLAIENDKGRVYDRFRERLMFPIRNLQGKTIGFGARALGDAKPKYLNSPETAIFHKGKELYGLYEAKQAGRLPYALVVEGYMDVVSLFQHGLPYAVATLGTSFSTEHLSVLSRYAQKIVFCFDGDDAGKNAAWRALEVVLPRLKPGLECRFMFMPDGEDPDTLVRRQGKVLFEERVSQAMALSDYFLETLASRVDLTHIEAKSQLAAISKPYIQKIPDPLMRRLLTEGLAKKTQTDSLFLQQLIESPSVPIQSRTPRKSQGRPSGPSPVRMLITLLLQYPQVLPKLNVWEELNSLTLPGIKLLLEMVEIIKNSPQVTTALLLEHWRGQEDGRILGKLAAWQHQIPEDGLVSECQGAMNQLRRLAREHQLDALLETSKKRSLDALEKSQLQALLTSKDQ